MAKRGRPKKTVTQPMSKKTFVLYYHPDFDELLLFDDKEAFVKYMQTNDDDIPLTEICISFLSLLGVALHEGQAIEIPLEVYLLDIVHIEVKRV